MIKSKELKIYLLEIEVSEYLDKCTPNLHHAGFYWIVPEYVDNKKMGIACRIGIYILISFNYRTLIWLPFIKVCKKVS